MILVLTDVPVEKKGDQTFFYEIILLLTEILDRKIQFKYTSKRIISIRKKLISSW